MMLSRYAAQLDNERLQDENDELQRKQRRDLFTTAAIVAILAIGTWIFGYRRQRRYQQRMTELTDEITRISQQTTESKESPISTTSSSSLMSSPPSTIPCRATSLALTK